jgi:L-seryl-tRNA(Ser) seleniumtransferase
LKQGASPVSSTLRKIPPVGTLLDREEVARLARRYSRAFITDLVREAVEDLRRSVAEGRADSRAVERFTETLPSRIEEAISRRFGGRVATVLNATGVIVHTNLGRSPLSRQAVARMAEAAAGYCDLEYRVDSGERGSRQEHIESLIARLLPGYTGFAVNNNAGAVLLALNTLAEGREVLISRGELVEIGGSFRIPDVMAKSGGVLHEVGTTNRTRIADFESALSDRTGLLLKVHTSNYRIVGFVEETPLARLVDLGRKRGVPVLVDQGSGNLLDLSAHGVKNEPTVSDLLRDGADVVTFSGDKLLGGPQAGILAGRTEILARMRANPLYRALRPDKMTVAGLEATLEAFVAGSALEEIPALRMLTRSAADVRARTEAFLGRLTTKAGGDLEMRVEAGVSRVGGGAAPMEDLPTFLLAVRPRTMSAESYEGALRLGSPPVVARVREGWVLLDLRTILDDQEEALFGALIAASRR